MTVSSDHNADALARGFHSAADALGDLETVNTEAGRVVLAAARPPRGATGQLGATLTARATGRDVTMAAGVRYWTFVHFGAPRIHVKAQPFILAALLATRAEVLDLYTTHTRDSLRKVP